MGMLAAGSTEVALAFVEVGAIAFGLSLLARLAGRIGMTAVPLYLVAGLAFGEGGLVQLDVSESFVALMAEIGVLLLLFALGLEYSDTELREGLRTGWSSGVVDMAFNALPGVAMGLLLGWEPLAAVLLGGATWISSSGVVSKVLRDLGRLGFRETPAVLNLLVIEDLAMAVYLPVVAALIVGGTLLATMGSVLIALGVVFVIMVVAMTFGPRISNALAGGTDESFLLATFGVILLVAGLAQQLEVSGAIGAFLVGLALSGRAEQRASELIAPLRDLFAAVFFVFFSFQVDPSDLPSVIVAAMVLAVVTTFTKFGSGWYAARRIGVGRGGQVRAGATLVARGEFSIVIAALGVTLADGGELGALVACYVLVTALAGPVLAKFADRLAASLPPPRRSRADQAVTAT
jgi:CPA2 family monovalent cation:H+ antiporter-2